MKKTIGLALVLALGFQFLMKLGIIAYFQLNQAYIIEAFCENKERPLLYCDGQCFLTKKLQATEEADLESEGTRTAKQQIETPFFLVSTPSLISFESEELLLLIPSKDVHYSFIQLKSLFHPPKLS